MFQANTARSARLHAQDALVDTYLRTIGVSGEIYTPSDEREALWELAELAAGEVRVREQLIDRWLQTPDLAGGASLRRRGTAGCGRAERRPEEPRGPADRRTWPTGSPARWRIRGKAMRTAGKIRAGRGGPSPWMEPEDAARVVQRLAETLEKPETSEEFRPWHLSRARRRWQPGWGRRLRCAWPGGWPRCWRIHRKPIPSVWRD